jgi:hypothetical protein
VPTRLDPSWSLAWWSEVARAAGAGSAGRLRLRPTRAAALRARRALRRLGLPRQLAHDALLLVTELVSNSVRHAGLAPG